MGWLNERSIVKGMTQSFTWSNGDRPYPRDGSPNFAVPLKEEDAGSTQASCTHPMTLDTQMTLALLQELLLALRANDPDDFKAWLSLGIERLGKPAVIELLVDWMDPILTTEEADRLVGWHLGVSL